MLLSAILYGKRFETKFTEGKQVVKIYLLTRYIMKIEPRVFSIQHQTRVLSLTGMLNSAAMASIDFFLLNELVKKRSIGQLKHMPNNGGYLLALALLNFVHG